MKGDLGRIASGTFSNANPGTQGNNTTYVSNAEACRMQPSPGATPPATAIDPKQLVQRACGFFEMDVNSTSTTLSTDYIWGLGGNIAAGDGTINKQLYRYQSNEFAVDTAAFTDSFTEVGTANASAGSSDYLNRAVFSNIPFIVGPVQYTAGSSDSAFATMKNRSWRSQFLQVAGNFENGKIDLAADRCSPCFNSDDNVVQWTFTAPISSVTPLSILVPDGSQGTFRFCTKTNGITYDFIECE